MKSSVINIDVYTKDKDRSTVHSGYVRIKGMSELMTPQQVAVNTTLADQMNNIIRIASYLEKGQRNTTRLMEITGLSRKTVIKYRNEAIKLLQEENKPMNSEAMRHMEVGRLTYWIDYLQEQIQALTGGEDKDKDYKIKLLGRLNDFQGRLHSITGLNTTVNLNYEEKKRITFNMTGTLPATAPSSTPTDTVLPTITSNDNNTTPTPTLEEGAGVVSDIEKV